MTAYLSLSNTQQAPALNQIIDDCKTIWVENIFQSRWFRIKAYHEMGLRILEEPIEYGKQIVPRVAESLGLSTRSVYRAVEFARLFPSLDLLPAGKNVSWYQVINKYIPERKGLLPEANPNYVFVCPYCKKATSKSDVKFVESADNSSQ